MRTSRFLLSGIVALCISQASNADERIAVVVPAVLGPDAPIGEAVKRECAVESHIGNQVFQRVSEKFPGAGEIRSPGQAEPESFILNVTILSVLGAGGGGWSGSKSISIRAEVSQNAKVVATTVLNRQSGGGVFGGVSGTCAIMDRIAVALGRDVAAWLLGQMMAVRHARAASVQPAAQAPKEESASPAASGEPASEPKQ